jgi:predicted metalloendopeptidase
MSNTNKNTLKILKNTKSQPKPFNKTKKILPNKILPNKTSQEIVCNDKQRRTFEPFEAKVEQKFAEQKIDFTSANYNLEKQIIDDLKKAVSPSNITPNTDFYSYINERWLNDFQVNTGQEYIVQVDNFRIVQDKVYRELIEIIQKYTTDSTTKNTELGICIHKMHKSLLTTNTNEMTSKYALQYLSEIDELRKDKNNLWKLLGKINRSEIISWGAPIVWMINVDDKNPTIYKTYITSGKLTFSDITLYFDDGTNVAYKKKYKLAYFDYLDKLFEHTFGKNHGFNVKDVYDCEVKMVNAYGCDIIKQTDVNNYNLVTKKEAIDSLGFNWEAFATALGFTNVPEKIIVVNLNYLLCMTQLLLKEWDSLQWRTYFVYMYIRQAQRNNEIGRHIFFNFNGHFLLGQGKLPDPEIYSVFGVGYAFSTFLNNAYIDKYNNKEVISYVEAMSQDLKTVFSRIIKRNKWLQPKTKAIALKKLNNFKINIGSSKTTTKDPLLDYIENDPWGNLYKTSQFRHNLAITLDGKKVINLPIVDWSVLPPKFVSNQSYVVNAMYTPSQNGIDVPLGYLQKPFVDLDERGIEYNLAHIGFTIGHEMSHALDDWGSKYDEYGRLNNWWTKKDINKYKKIQADVIKQYEVFASYDGIKFDAAPSIGEDLADISGLAICLEYLRDFQLKNMDILPIQRLSFEVFFVYFAFQQRQHISKKAIVSQLITNPHPLDKYRTNVPLSRLQVFRTIYNVKKGDKMWWHSTNRVWGD